MGSFVFVVLVVVESVCGRMEKSFGECTVYSSVLRDMKEDSVGECCACLVLNVRVCLWAANPADGSDVLR
jgi:hypothetical protein